MSRPLVGIAVGVGIGTWLGLVVGISVAVLPCAVFFAVICIVLHLFHRGWLANVSIHILIVLLTWFFASQSEERSIANLMTAQGIDGGCRAVLTGRIASDITDAGKADGGWGRIRFSVRAKRLVVNDIESCVDDVVQVVMHGTPRYPPVYGETWSMNGRLYPFTQGKRSGPIRYGFQTGLSSSECVKDTQLAFLAWGHDARRRAAEMLAVGIEEYAEVTGVIHAMLLGYRSHLPPEVRDCFRRTGTMHIFAISGLHVTIFCSVVVFALAVFGVPRTMWVLGLAPIICTYTIVTGARASAIRASAMVIAYLLAPLLRRRPDTISAFAFAAILILLWNPQQLMDVGFIYSFAVVAGIIIITPIFDTLFMRVWQHDKLALPEMVAATRWWRLCLRYAVGLFSVSLAAWLTSTPLSLHFFGRFSPVALLGNLIAIPLAFMIIVTGCLSLLAGSMIGVLGEIFNCANWCFVKMLVSGMQALEQIPYGWVDCGNLPLWGVFLWYAALIAVVVWVRRRLKRMNV